MKHIYLVEFEYSGKYSWYHASSAFFFTTMKKAAAYGERWYRLTPDCEGYRIVEKLGNAYHEKPENFAR